MVEDQATPGISNAVQAVARYAHTPKYVHWKAALRFFKCFRVTNGFGAIFQQGSGLNLEVFTNARYASNATDQRSVSGGRVTCGGAAVSWFSRTQKSITFSTTGAECVATSEWVKKAIFMSRVGALLCLPAVYHT